mmetsp:Transcript_9609/g.16876  ORF Transcript_9609/g.16876 Transcript_9609/m.16876 type:complete len:278 (+) Transcript_9609:71-904(+)
MVLRRTRLSLQIFVAYTLIQIAAFLYFPKEVLSLSPISLDEPPYPFIRMIGAYEIGLMAMYSAMIYVNDPAFYMMSCAFRALALFHALYMIVYFDAPFQMLLAISQDIIGAIATFVALRLDLEEDGKLPPRKLCSPPEMEGAFEQLTRSAILGCGAVQLFMAYTAYFDPAGCTTVAADLSMPPLYVGSRSVSFMLFVIALYTLGLGILRGSWEVYFGIGLFQLYSGLLITYLDAVTGDEGLSQNVHCPKHHLVFGTLISALSCLCLTTPPSPKEKRD